MLRFIIAGAAGAVAVVVEQSLTGVTNAHRVVLAVMTLIPFAAVYFWLELRARKDAAPKPAQRTAFSPYRPGR